MKLKIYTQCLMLVLSLCLLGACYSYRDSKPKQPSSASVESNKHGVNIEAKYDPRLDNLIPGYKIITIGLTNNSIDVLKLNTLKDRWTITDAYGKNRRGLISLRISDPRTFSHLPDKLKRIIDYPVGIAMGYSETFDLFFPNSLDLDGFRSINFYSSELDQDFNILTDLGEPSPETRPVNDPKGLNSLSGPPEKDRYPNKYPEN